MMSKARGAHSGDALMTDRRRVPQHSNERRAQTSRMIFWPTGMRFPNRMPVFFELLYQLTEILTQRDSPEGRRVIPLSD